MKSLISSLLLLFFITGFAQKDFQGKAVYQKKVKVDISRFENNKDIPPERKKMFIEMMKERSNRKYILNFNKSASIYKQEEKLSTPGKGGMRFGGFSGGFEYKNIAEKKFLTSTEFFGKKFLITNKDSMPTWEMTTETKKIGNYTCYKATYKKKNRVQSFRGFARNEKQKKRLDSIAKTKPKEILVTAWYTPQIPVSTGPERYWGLPGLILELSEGTSTILCTEIVLNPDDKIEIKEPTKGDKVTREEYRELMTKKMEEMRDRFGRRRGSGGRPRG